MLAVSVGDLNNWKMIPASQVNIGDHVQITGGGVAKIISIETVRRRGVYAPLTFSGKIVASHVQASAYISIQNAEHLMLGSAGETRVLVTHQWLAQSILLPIRWIGAFTATHFNVDVFPWLPQFFMACEPTVVKTLQLPAPVLLLVVVPLVASLSGIALVEYILLLAWSYKCLTALLILVGGVTHKVWSESGMTVRASKKKSKVH